MAKKKNLTRQLKDDSTRIYSGNCQFEYRGSVKISNRSYALIQCIFNEMISGSVVKIFHIPEDCLPYVPGKFEFYVKKESHLFPESKSGYRVTLDNRDRALKVTLAGRLIYDRERDGF
jgi:hypothetical protein